MAVTTTKTNKPLNPRGNDQSPKGYNRASLFSGKALDFDGVNDRVITENNLPFSSGDDLSIVSYFKIDDSNEGYFYQNAAIYLAVYRDGSTSVGELSGFVSGSWLDTGYIVNDSKWYQVAQIVDNGTQRIYLNGQEIATQSGVSYNPGSQTVLNIGKRDSNYLNGQMANIKAFNVALTAAQVADLYNNPEKIVPTGVADSALKLYLPMMEGAGTTAYDGSGNGNHGTISGATWTHGVGAPVAQTAVIDWNKGQNYVEHSEEIDDAYYTKTNATITADDITAPDGQSTADKVNITSDSQSGVRAYKQINAAQYTMSFYAKAGTQTDIKFYVIQQGVAVYTIDIDLTNGTLSNISAGISDSSITDAGNGWWRITATRTFTAAASNHGYGAVVSNGNGTNFYLWGFQHKQASSVGPYVPTFGTAQTSDVLLPQGLTSGRDITGVNLFENVRKQGALNLDGNSWAEVHDNASLDITDAVSVEMWIYWEDQSAESTILGKWLSGANRAYALIATTTTGEIDFRQRVSSSTYSLGISTLSSGWNHVVATHDHSANERIGYINGVQVSTSSSQGVSNASDNDVTIGGSATAQYTNSIAQPRIYNRALTAAEVLQNYNSGKSIYTNS